MVARIPHSAAGLLLTLHIVLTLDQGYAAAGAAVAVMTLGIALGARWRGYRVDIACLRRALVPSVIAELVIWAIMPHVSYQSILPLVFFGGLLTLPIFSVIRQSLGVLVDDKQRRTAFALDSIATELVFMIGPAVGAVVATAGFSVAGLTVVGVSTSLVGLFLIWFNPPTRSTHGSSDDSRNVDAAETALVASAPAHLQEEPDDLDQAASTGSAGPQSPGLLGRMTGSFTWFSASVAAVFAVAAGTGMVLSGTDVGIVAVLERGGHQTDIGIVFFFWCAASMVGGLAYGAMQRAVSPILLLLGMAALTIPVGFATNAWTLALLSILPGLLCAPVLSSASEKVAELVDEARRGEAMGWYCSALTAGVALGAPVAGIFIDGIGTWSSFVMVGSIGIVLCLAGLALQNLREAST